MGVGQVRKWCGLVWAQDSQLKAKLIAQDMQTGRCVYCFYFVALLIHEKDGLVFRHQLGL